MDKDLRLQILRAVARDRRFLKQSAGNVDADAFPTAEETCVAQVSVEYYEKYEEPIGPLLRAETADYASSHRFSPEQKKTLRTLIDRITGAAGAEIETVSVNALVDRVHTLKKHTFYDTAVADIIATYDKGKLDADYLATVIDRASKELSTLKLVGSDYYSTAEDRIARRAKTAANKYPLLLLDPLDRKIQAIGKGHLALFVGAFKSGKGMGLLHIASAYAMQGLKVLVITLEDPKDIVENRLDAAATGLPISRLRHLPNKFKKRFARIVEEMRGSIRVVDGTEGGFTVPQIERCWEENARDGFVADAIVVDYDDEIECEVKFPGESARRMEFAHIYRRLRKLAAKLHVIIWTASQGNRGAEKKKDLYGSEIAEDVSKLRKVTLAIGIGSDPKKENVKRLRVMAHKLDMDKFSVDIACDFGSGIFFDRELTHKMSIRDPDWLK